MRDSRKPGRTCSRTKMLANMLANMFVIAANQDEHVREQKCWPTFTNFFVNVSEHFSFFFSSMVFANMFVSTANQDEHVREHVRKLVRQQIVQGNFLSKYNCLRYIT